MFGVSEDKLLEAVAKRGLPCSAGPGGLRFDEAEVHVWAGRQIFAQEADKHGTRD